MGKKIQRASHFRVEELERRYRQASEATERSRWQIVWLVSQGQMAREVVASTGYSSGQIAKCYTAERPVGLVNR